MTLKKRFESRGSNSSSGRSKKCFVFLHSASFSFGLACFKGSNVVVVVPRPKPIETISPSPKIVSPTPRRDKPKVKIPKDPEVKRPVQRERVPLKSPSKPIFICKVHTSNASTVYSLSRETEEQPYRMSTKSLPARPMNLIFA